jgi:hypothetical protein
MKDDVVRLWYSQLVNVTRASDVAGKYVAVEQSTLK